MHVFAANTRAPPRTRRKKKQAPVAEQRVPCIYTARKDARGRAYPKEVLGIWATKPPSPDRAERLFTDVNRAGDEQPTDSRHQPPFLLRFLPLHLISARPKKRPQYMDPGMHGTQRYRTGIPSRPRNNSSILLVCCAIYASLEPGRTLVMHWSVVGYGFLRGYYSPSPKPCP